MSGTDEDEGALHTDEEDTKRALGFQPYMESEDLMGGAADAALFARLDEVGREEELAARFEKHAEFKKNWVVHLEALCRKKAEMLIKKAPSERKKTKKSTKKNNG